jgi:putative membrane protein
MIKIRYEGWLLIVFVAFGFFMGIGPNYRWMWFVENVLIGIFLIFLIAIYGRFRFSKLSYTLLFLFGILQTTGAHYTYAEVPFGFITELFGFERNHYDRLVHLAFGLLFAIPFREFLVRVRAVREKSKFSYYFPVEAAFAFGALYEIIEWLFAIFSDPSATVAFLGAQGDIWDSQIDMLLAGIGAAITMGVARFWRKV